MHLQPGTNRRGAMALEAALVFPVLLALLLGVIVGGIAVFHHQQVACLAQEAARYACTRGGDYQKDSDNPSPTLAEIRDQVVLPLAVSIDPDQLSVHIQWIDHGSNQAYDWDNATKDVRATTPQGEYVNNAVRVTVTYAYSAGVLFGPVTLTSVAEVPMLN